MGHAFKNSELNWHWNEYVRDPLKKSNNDTQYIFTATAGEEPFWYCYFTTGSKKQGNAKSLDCTLDSGMIGECQVQ